MVAQSLAVPVFQHIWHHSSTGCIGHQYISKCNSQCWQLKPFVTWDWVTYGVISSTHPIWSYIRACSESHPPRDMFLSFFIVAIQSYICNDIYPLDQTGLPRCLKCSIICLGGEREIASFRSLVDVVNLLAILFWRTAYIKIIIEDVGLKYTPFYHEDQFVRISLIGCKDLQRRKKGHFHYMRKSPFRKLNIIPVCSVILALRILGFGNWTINPE